jgi:hypothetical protein
MRKCSLLRRAIAVVAGYALALHILLSAGITAAAEGGASKSEWPVICSALHKPADSDGSSPNALHECDLLCTMTGCGGIAAVLTADFSNAFPPQRSQTAHFEPATNANPRLIACRGQARAPPTA